MQRFACSLQSYAAMQVTATEKGESHKGHLAQTEHQTITSQAMAWYRHVIMTVFKPRYAKF